MDNLSAVEEAMEQLTKEERADELAKAYDAAYKRSDIELHMTLDDTADKLRHVGPVSCRELLFKLALFLEKNDPKTDLRDGPWATH